MEAPTPPQLSAYDFLGYIVPGLVLIFLADLSYQYHAFGSLPSYQIVSERYMKVSLVTMIPVLLVAYFFGHLVSFVSSITVERHAAWMHGKPARVLIYGYELAYLDTGRSSNKIASMLLRLLVFCFMLPIGFVEVTVGKWLGLSRNYIHPADALIQTAFLKAMSHILDSIGITVSDFNGRDASEYELERLAIHCALERAPAHVYTLRNYVVLFGFLRAMCLICLGVFWCVFLHLIYGAEFYRATWFFILATPLVFVCYAGYLKFQFRYHLEAIMAIIATTPPKKITSKIGRGPASGS